MQRKRVASARRHCSVIHRSRSLLLKSSPLVSKPKPNLTAAALGSSSPGRSGRSTPIFGVECSPLLPTLYRHHRRTSNPAATIADTETAEQPRRRHSDTTTATAAEPGLMEIGCGIPNGLHGVENFEDGKDIKMSELEEGELVEMISKTELGENSAIVSKIESQETRAGTENLVNKDSGTLSDLVKEVEAIQACGGQKTADGRRFRIGGGILWNIIKAREPNAYKEIMKRGKEFEKQLKQVPKTPLIKQEAKDATSQNTPGTVTDKPVAIASDGSSLPSNMMCDSQEQSTSGPQRQSVYNRIRMPVSYDDLFEDVQQNAI
nr:phosphorylated adapter RNA export protein [Ipomoea batatas]